jgi:hypothetical protein
MPIVANIFTIAASPPTLANPAIANMSANTAWSAHSAKFQERATPEGRRLLGRAYAVLQDRVIDVHPAHLIGVGVQLVPHVLDPQDRQPRLKGELPPQFLRVRYSRSSYVGSQPDIHKNLIYLLEGIMALAWVGSPDRCYPLFCTRAIPRS